LYANERETDWLPPALIALAIVAFAYELLSLYTTPLYDSYLWWGDESWLMLEFRSQILTGYFHHPFAYGSSLHATSGLLFSNMWLTAVVYGLPAALMQSVDIVSLGRTITAVLAAVLLGATYWSARRAEAGRTAALLAVVLVVTTRTFFLTSHSARYDILSALAILIFVTRLLVLSRRGLTVRDAFLVGLAFTGSLLVSVHIMLALAFAVPLVILLRSDHTLPSIRSFAFGAAIPVIVFLIIAVASGAHSVFGYTGSSGFFSQVQNVPALRPFSRSVQMANLLQRLDMALRLAGPLTLLSVCALIVAMIPGFRRRHSLPMWWLPLSIIVSWLLFESSAPTSYLIYIVPVVAVSASVLLSTLPPLVLAIVAAVPVALLPFSILNAESLGNTLTTYNDASVGEAIAHIRTDPKPGPVLTINLGVHELLNAGLPIMTTQFVEFPASSLSPDSVLRQNNVHYMLLYQSPLHPDYMREILPLTRIAHDRGTLVFSRAAAMTDIARDYFAPNVVITAPMPADTLQLYLLHD
jgi:hypothetical protein